VIVILIGLIAMGISQQLGQLASEFDFIGGTRLQFELIALDRRITRLLWKKFGSHG